MTDIERSIIEHIQSAAYLDDETRRQWIETITKDGLNPTTTRLLLSTLVDRMLGKLATQCDPNDPFVQKQFRQLIDDLDRTESEVQHTARTVRSSNDMP